MRQGSSFAVILNDDRTKVFLSLRWDMPMWNSPGGGIEDGETPEQAMIRELKEEAGIDGKIIRKVGLYRRANKHPIHCFECSFTGTPAITIESLDHQWFDLSDLPKNLSGHQIMRIKDAVNKATIDTDIEASSAKETLAELDDEEILSLDIWKAAWQDRDPDQFGDEIPNDVRRRFFGQDI